MCRFAAHLQTQKLVIRSKRRVTTCLIVRRRTCSPRWHTGRVPQTEVSERLVLHPFTRQTKTRCVQYDVRPRPWTIVPTLRARLTVDFTKKGLNTDGMHSSNLAVTNVEFSVPYVVTSMLRATLS